MTTPEAGPNGLLGPDELSDRLDRLYCFHLMMVQWSLATAGRLAASARHLLQTDLARDSRFHLESASRLAERVTQLGGTVTGDPCDLPYRAPIDSIRMPNNPAGHHEVLVLLDRVTTSAISAYLVLLNVIGGSDPVSQRIIEDLLKAATTRLGDVRSASAIPPTPEQHETIQ